MVSKIKSSKIFLALVSAICCLAFFVPKTATVSARELPKTLLSVSYGNVTGKGVQKVELFAEFENKGLYATNVYVAVSDAKTGAALTEIHPETNSGYSPAITLADFTGDGVKEIFLGMDSGGSGGFGYYYIYALSGDKTQTLFDYAEQKNEYVANYADGYKVNVTFLPTEDVFTIDISDRGAEYLGVLYNSDGTLKKPVAAEVSAVNTVLPFFVNYDRRYNVLVMRRITGLYNADSFGYTQDFMSYEDGNFSTYFRTVAIN